MPHEVRIETKDMLIVKGQEVVFTGTVVKLEEDHGFIARDGSGDQIFFHRLEQDPEKWPELRLRKRVAFKVGFSFSGVKGLGVQSLS